MFHDDQFSSDRGPPARLPPNCARHGTTVVQWASRYCSVNPRALRLIPTGGHLQPTGGERSEFDVITHCELAIGSQPHVSTRPTSERLKLTEVTGPAQHAGWLTPLDKRCAASFDHANAECRTLFWPGAAAHSIDYSACSGAGEADRILGPQSWIQCGDWGSAHAARLQNETEVSHISELVRKDLENNR